MKKLLIIALVAVLVITGSVFAFTFTTATATIGVTAVQSDFAEVSANLSGWTNPSVFGRFTGIWPTTTLFDITPATGYTGDLVIHVYLTNTGELIRRYHHCNMKLEFHDSTGANVSTKQEYELLNLSNADVLFEWAAFNGTAPYRVDLVGGSYRLHPWRQIGGSVSPDIWCEVTQR
jgi:hypothetical protein